MLNGKKQLYWRYDGAGKMTGKESGAPWNFQIKLLSSIYLKLI